MELDCGAWVNLISHRVKRQLDRSLAELGINSFQSRVLHYIRAHYREGPVFQRDVENVFAISRSTATGILQHLERKLRRRNRCNAKYQRTSRTKRRRERNLRVFLQFIQHKIRKKLIKA